MPVCIIRFIVSILFVFGCFTTQILAGQESPIQKAPQTESVNPLEKSATSTDTSMKMLYSVIKLKNGLSQRMEEKNNQLKKSRSATEKELLKSELEKMDRHLNDYKIDFERIATGIDISLFSKKKAEKFDWKSEVIGLVEPGIKEIKRFTVKARNKTKLKDERSQYEELAPIAKQAVENIQRLISQTDDPKLKKNLVGLLPEWQGIEKQIQNKLEIVNMRLSEMEKDEKSFLESSQDSIKHFFRTRGLFLIVAFVACLCVMLLFKLFARLLVRFIPGYTAEYRPFHIRIISLLSRILSVTLVLFVLLFVFYIFEDWVLLSLTIIFIMGVGWAAKHTLPKYWHQSRLMLNIGAVREGERMDHLGIPWMVRHINLFSEIENPDLEVKLRLPIERLLDKTSRPFHKNEPWFPCRRGDWVVLSDGTRGVITSQTHEMVEMVQRGGARKTYQTQDFLSMSPLNLSVNFRLKVPFGISYDLQKDATGSILETMQAYIDTQIEKEGYKESLMNLRVEFAQAAASSLDLVVIADFKGDMAPLYQRLNRAIQRWCTDACTINNWEIPFAQLTIHQNTE